jgi:TFIIF-interacting CTD phosphatase-like protein
MGIYRCVRDTIPSTSTTDKCIVLDLDETLIHTSERISQLEKLEILTDPSLFHLRERVYILEIDDVVDKPGMGNTSVLWGIKRPGLHEFLLFCFQHFRIVAVWSAGKARYVEAICQEIFKDLCDPHIIFTWDHCETGDDYLEKPLQKMIEEFNDPRMTIKNTVAIDDRKSTFSDVNPENGILIPAYDPVMNVKKISKNEKSLSQLQEWFKNPEFVNTHDVRELNKSNIFV